MHESPQTDQPTAQCFGELLSYGQAGFDGVLKDWANDSLQYHLLNGRFLLVFWDDARQEWTFITDRLGAYHSYAVWRGDKIAVVGTDLVQLSRSDSKRQLDWDALATFFAFGFFLDDRTYYDDIRILQPASIYRIAKNGELQSHQRYWNWHHTIDEQRSYDQTLEQYDTLLRQAVSRCLMGRVLLPISGGLDSRSLAYALAPIPATQSYSYGYTGDSIEIRIASRIAQKRNFSFHGHVISPYLFPRLLEVTAALHGSQDITQARQVSVSQWVAERADAVLTGLWGDVWCDQMGAADGLPDDTTITDHVQKLFQKRGRDWLLEHVIAPHFPKPNMSDYLFERIEAGIKDFEQIQDIDFRIKAYKTSRWAFRWSNASLRGFEIGAVPRIPYYDVDLIDFFCTVPTAFARDRRLQIDHLKRFAPDLASITWQQAGVNLHQAQYARWLTLPNRVSGKIQRTLLRERPIQRNWEVQFLGIDGRQQLEKHLLEGRSEINQIVPTAQVKKLIEDFYAHPTASNGYTLSMMLTFVSWLELVS